MEPYRAQRWRRLAADYKGLRRLVREVRKAQDVAKQLLPDMPHEPVTHDASDAVSPNSIIFI